MLAALPLLLALTSARAEIRETSSMAEALATAAPGTLVLLDVDNTLITPAQSFGGYPWYQHVVETLEAGGMAHEAAAEEGSRLWRALLDRIAMRTCEADTAALVAALQQRGIQVMGLTARSVEMAPWTRQQLTSVGIDLTPGAEGPRWEGTGGQVLEQGVVYVGEGMDKGRALVEYLGARGPEAGPILFVDDREHNVRAVDAALTAAERPVLAFRYGLMDDEAERFDAAAADLELYLLQHPLDDATARAVLEAVPALRQQTLAPAPAAERAPGP